MRSSLTAICALAALGALLPAGAAAQVARVDETRLPGLFEELGHESPATLRALVGVIDVGTQDGQEAQEAPRAEWYDWQGTSQSRDDWWPASSIKLYAAVAALERSREMGFMPAAMLTYHYESEDEDEYRGRLSQIVRHAIVASNNLAFDRLVEFVGMDYLNRRFFTEDNGLENTVFLRAYGGRNRNPDNGHAVNRHSPPITVERGRRVRGCVGSPDDQPPPMCRRGFRHPRESLHRHPPATLAESRSGAARLRSRRE